MSMSKSDPYATLHPFAASADASAMIGFTDADGATAKRNELLSLVWGTPNLPAIDALYHAGSPNNTWPNLQIVDSMTYDLPYGFSGTCYAYRPINFNNRLILYHDGHNPNGFWTGASYIKHFVEKGCVVVAFSMPTFPPNNRPVVGTAYGTILMSDHRPMACLPTGPYSPLALFVEPVIRALNRIPLEYYTDVTMLGYSGGGWTTSLCAALDERINYSFPVAGSLPSWIRFLPPNDNNSSVGDFEQNIPEFFQHVDWTELYALGTTSGRKQVQVLNQYDPCCFAGINYQCYEEAVSSVASSWNGDFSVWLDKQNQVHSISDAALAMIDSTLGL
jgi:hypothetical protein